MNQKKPLVVSAWAPVARGWASGWLCVDWKVQPRDLSVDWGFSLHSHRVNQSWRRGQQGDQSSGPAPGTV